MFEINKIYKRSELHIQYGGNGQSGIANCAGHPFIFIFTGKAGEQHGYEDGWDEENYFNYTGEGQNGDMTFTKGNRALRDHQKNGKAVYLFESQSKGLWRFVEQVELVDYSYFPTPDSAGHIRQGIKFKFRSSTGQSVNAKGAPRISRNYNKPDKTERKGLVTSRVGQGWYRRELITRWDGKCAVTNCSRTDILIASHIVAWKGATDAERLDIDNGILLSPTYDALFDKHLISFDEQGKIVISPLLNPNTLAQLRISGEERITGLTEGNLRYLERHRARMHKIN
jgi:hypothetical protein